MVRGSGRGALGVVSGIVSVNVAGGMSVSGASSSWDGLSRTCKFGVRCTICVRSYNARKAGVLSVVECVVPLLV